jgi:hypothetical protein
VRYLRTAGISVLLLAALFFILVPLLGLLILWYWGLAE